MNDNDDVRYLHNHIASYSTSTYMYMYLNMENIPK